MKFPTRFLGVWVPDLEKKIQNIIIALSWNFNFRSFYLTLQAEPFLTVHILCTEKRINILC